jgi:hypothetical protein
MTGAESTLAIALLVALLVIDRLVRWQGTLVVAARAAPAAARGAPQPEGARSPGLLEGSTD